MASWSLDPSGRNRPRSRPRFTCNDFALRPARGYTHPRHRPPHPDALPMRMRFLLAAVAVGLTCPAARAADPQVDPYDQSKVPLEIEPPADFKGKKIVLVAGTRSHGPGDHEFFAGTAILMNLLKQSEGVWPVMARDGWPKNEKIFDGAASVLFYMDGRGGHP